MTGLLDPRYVDRLAQAVQAVGARRVAKLIDALWPASGIRALDIEDVAAWRPINPTILDSIRNSLQGRAIDVMIAVTVANICRRCGTVIYELPGRVRPIQRADVFERWKPEWVLHTVCRCQRARKALEELARGYDASHDAFINRDPDTITDARSLLARLDPPDWTPPKWWSAKAVMHLVEENEQPHQVEAARVDGPVELRLIRGGR